MGSKRWIIVSATLAVVAAIGVARAFPSGPSVSTGSNPIRYFQYVDQPCTKTDAGDCAPSFKKKQVFEVPVGQTLVVTDFRVSDYWPVSGTPATSAWNYACKSCLLAEGKAVACESGWGLLAIVPWSTGLAIPSGAKVELLLTGGNKPNIANTCAAVATGYLTRN